MEFSITGRGGVYPIQHFFYYLFSDSKVTIFSKILGFLLVFCLQIRPLIPSHSIPFLSNPIIFNTIIHLSPNPKGRKMRQKQRKFVPWMLKKIINKFHTLPPRAGGSKKYGKFHTFFLFYF